MKVLPSLGVLIYSQTTKSFNVLKLHGLESTLGLFNSISVAPIVYEPNLCSCEGVSMTFTPVTFANICSTAFNAASVAFSEGLTVASERGWVALAISSGVGNMINEGPQATSVGSRQSNSRGSPHEEGY